MATGINVSKSNIYSVLSVPTGIDVSKSNIYSVLSIPTGINVSKSNIYAVLTVQDNWTFTNTSKKKLLDGTFDLDTDLFKIALHLSTGTQPSSTIVNWSELATSEHAAANGYTAGGLPTGGGTTLALSGTTNVMIDIAVDPTWSASGGSIVAKWAVIYEVGGAVLCYCLLDSAAANITITNGNTLTIAEKTTGIFTVA